MSDHPTVLLNKLLTQTHRESSLSWEEQQDASRKWVCVCKIDGLPCGQGVSERKHVAKNLAAAQALAHLDKVAKASKASQPNGA